MKCLLKRFRGFKSKLAAASALTSLLLLHAGAQPVNDAFAGRLAISGTDFAATNTLQSASSEMGEPFIPGVSSGQTAWWSWTAPHSGIASLSAAATTFTPLLAVYVGDSLSSLSLTASNNYWSCFSGACGCHWSMRHSFSFHVQEGQTYQIAVDSAVLTSPITSSTGSATNVVEVPTADRWFTNVPAGGNYTLQLSLAARPANDDFDHPIILQGKRAIVSASNAGATKQPGEPDHSGNPGGSSVWFAWKAPASGQVMLATNEPPVYLPPTSTGSSSDFVVHTSGDCGDDLEASPITFFPVFGVYTGSAVDALNPAGIIPVGLSAYSNAVYFDAIKDQVYRIAFDGNQGTTAQIKLYLALTTPAVNDRFEQAIRLRSIYATATGYNTGAGSQPGEPVAAPGSVGKTVWWSWRAPVSGPVAIDLAGSDFAFPTQVFARRGALSLISNGTGHVDFDAVAGQTYYIAVYDAAGQPGAIRLTLNGPVVALALKHSVSTTMVALLQFASQPGQKILLQGSPNGLDWTNLRLAVSRRQSVSFLVSPPPTPTGPFYRAIVIDREW